ncbi:hypothetical protein NEOLEDRAFT_1142714 [Neolentinus lepideus HHB14362 ss-1]|uniref:Uncharacterized protein n=1 Tax=Neolentinus lepideus HHB14362 ss-1 TaxID=1314782 RepID=A0A165MY08_9AGAM|nr:hypothetical protein NEOLEDRAFT_1142714 [Neolentinus lepideus HHB14362 ss-1]
MNSFFSKDSIISGAKRPYRARGRKLKASTWKDLCEPLHAVPEEEEPCYQQTLPKTPSSCESGRPNQVIDTKPGERRASRPRPVGLTGAEAISLQGTIDLEYESPRPAPRPPLLSSDSEVSNSHSPDSFNLQFSDIGLVLNFPHPPKSPTPSLMSSCTSGSAKSVGVPTTPVTSDDEFCPSPAPVRPLVIPNKPVMRPDDENEWIDDSEWYAKQFEDILTLCSPLPVSLREPGSEKPRPESIVAPRRSSAIFSKDTGPSAQLDPTFPVRRRSAVKLPSRPPPAVPAVRRRSRASRDSRCPKNELTITIPCCPRPPPRMSVPADISESFSADGEQEFILSPETPSVYSQDTARSDCEFYAHRMASPARLDLDFQFSPMDLQLEIAATLEGVQRRAPDAAIPDTPVEQMYSPLSGVERALRSRWSSSTLSSITESQQPMSASSRMMRFNFVSRRGKTKDKLPSPKTIVERRSMDSVFDYMAESRTLGRRGSRSSKASDSAESCDSAGSNGLRRKPIPVEMFIRC